MKITVIVLIFVLLSCASREEKLVEVVCVKIHSVEDYKRAREKSLMNASFPFVVYEVVNTGERFMRSGGVGLCNIGDTIKIIR